MVRLVADKFDGTCRVDLQAFGHPFQDIFKFDIDDGRIFQVYFTYGIDLFVSIVNVLHFVDEPGITVRVWIQNGGCLSLLVDRENEILCIQHVQYLELAGIYTVHFSTGRCYLLKGCLHLGFDVVVYHFLITAQFGGMVSADAFVPVSSVVFVKCGGGKV